MDENETIVVTKCWGTSGEYYTKSWVVKHKGCESWNDEMWDKFSLDLDENAKQKPSKFKDMKEVEEFK